MSTIIRTRSPFFIRTQQETNLSLAYFDLRISVYTGTTGALEQCTSIYETYQLTKKPLPEEHSVTFEIAELIHNHLEQKYNGNYNTSALTQSLWINTNIFARNASGGQIGSSVSATYLCQEGFNTFSEGVNYVTEPDAMITSNTVQYLQGQAVYVPINNEKVGSVKTSFRNTSDATFNATDNGNNNQKIKYVGYNTASIPYQMRFYSGTNGTGTLYRTLNLESIEECKYPVKKITFLNRWGALQELFFFKKSTESMTATRESFDRSVFEARQTVKGLNQSGICTTSYNYNVYNIYEHSKQNFNSQAQEKTQLNTGYVSEDMNESFKELMVSEYVWLTDITTGEITPVNLIDSSFTSKTGLNDRMINYTMEFLHSAKYVNTIR